jgi:lauroyl/myristoyl acyltransferase
MAWSFHPEQFKGESEQPFYLLMQRPMAKHLRRPVIRVRTGGTNPEWNLGVAVEISSSLRRNELVCIHLDVGTESSDRKKAVTMDFLGAKATLQPGALRIAKLVGSPVLTMILRRAGDGRRLVLEFSPPMEVSDEIAAFRHCLDLIEATIRLEPAPWELWRMRRLVQLGLIPEADAIRFFNGKGKRWNLIREQTGPLH